MEVTPFDRFWSCYPRKIGKGAAIKAWEKLEPDEALTTSMILAIDAQIRNRRSLEDRNNSIRNDKFKKFIPDWPHPSTWLNGQRWLDELQSVSETREPTEQEKQKCPQCDNLEYLHCENKKKLCSWHFSKEHFAQGDTGLDKLREVYSRLGLSKQKSEGHDAHISRLRSICRTKAPMVGKVDKDRTGQHETHPEDL